MMNVQDFPLIEISGAPYERGKMHGEGAGGRVRLSVDHYMKQLEGMGVTEDDMIKIVERYVPKIKEWAPDLIEEMEGIAAGAKVSFASVVLINARTEVLQLAERKSEEISKETDGCTGVVVMPDAAAGGKLLHGQTWDWKYECAETAIVLRILREDGPDVLTFTEAGALARNGFNAAGIAITGNYLESDRDYRATGIPLAFIRRKALEARYLSEALRVIATTSKSGSNNMIVSSVEGFAISLECAPDETFLVYPEDDLIVHANHWQSPVALGKLKEAGLNHVPDSLYRDYRVRELLAKRQGKIDINAIKEAFLDKFGAPYSVCRPPVKWQSGNLSATVATIIFNVFEGIMDVTALPAINSNSVQYALKMDIAK